MSKQILCSADSAGLLQETGGKSIAMTNSDLSSSTSVPRKYKVLLLVVGVLAAVVVCAVAVVAVGTSQALKHSARQSEDQEQPQGDPLETRGRLLRQVRVHPLPIVILVQAQGVYTRFRLLDQYTHSCLSINKHTDC